MRRRDLERRILVRRQHARQLVNPLVPRLVAPVIIQPQEPALQQVRAQRLDLRVAELRGAGVFHADIRALIELGVGEPDDDVVQLRRWGPCSRASW